MIRFTCRAALLIALTAATPAFAQDWRVAAVTGAAPDQTVYLIDIQSIVRNGDTVDFTTQSIFQATHGDRKFDRSVTTRHGTCSAMSSRIMTGRYYAGGALQSSEDTPSPNIITHPPNSAMHHILAQVCGTEPFQPGTVADPEKQVRAYFAK